MQRDAKKLNRSEAFLEILKANSKNWVREEFIFEKIPMQPVSDNTLYHNVNFKNPHNDVTQYGREKTKGYRLFTSWMHKWALVNAKIIAEFKQGIHADQPLKVQILLMMSEDRVLCLDGSLKKIDAQNWTKGLIDVLFKILGIDDRQIFKLCVTKCMARKPEDTETCRVTIRKW